MPTTVILREVAVSMVECQGRLVLWLVRWQGKMDSATARGMTKFGFRGYLGMTGFRCYPEMTKFRCYRRNDERGAECQRPSYCAKSQYPSLSAGALDSLCRSRLAPQQFAGERTPVRLQCTLKSDAFSAVFLSSISLPVYSPVTPFAAFATSVTFVACCGRFARAVLHGVAAERAGYFRL